MCNYEGPYSRPVFLLAMLPETSAPNPPTPRAPTPQRQNAAASTP